MATEEKRSTDGPRSSDRQPRGIGAERVGARLRAARLAKGLSARAVAERAGVTPAYLSRLEADRVSPTLSTLIRVTDAIGEPLARIFDEGDTLGPLVRREDRRTVVSKGTVDALLSPSRDGRLQVVEMSAEPGADGGTPYTHWGEEECVVVLEAAQRWRRDHVPLSHSAHVAQSS
jgi:transcriptional regulator with XRE-family HTH domain